ncbi:RICIN domain-containing protein [Streptomyces coeruleorubidus]|uniref:RICIN domain-containing protein n=1 Tax=Streptomyces coeruleorubidus TaxID=116188 RepID=UPI0036F810B8
MSRREGQFRRRQLRRRAVRLQRRPQPAVAAEGRRRRQRPGHRPAQRQVPGRREQLHRARVQQYRCGTGTNQQWLLQDQGNGYHRLVARHSGKCLDVENGSTANGARLIQWNCGTGANQQFQQRTA